jgi:hypothetical protein
MLALPEARISAANQHQPISRTIDLRRCRFHTGEALTISDGIDRSSVSTERARMTFIVTAFGKMGIACAMPRISGYFVHGSTVVSI